MTAHAKYRDLGEALTAYAQEGRYPLHMPGHKRNTDRFSLGDPYSLDITEIDGFDDLHEPEGILKEGMDRAARVFGAKKSWFLVGGSTVGILAGIGALTHSGDTVLMARNCHKSVYHALELYHLHPCYVMPSEIPGWSFRGSVSPSEVEKALRREEGRVRLAVITSPTYEGILSDIESIAAVCHEAGVPLLVDEAHGAHLLTAFGGPQTRADERASRRVRRGQDRRGDLEFPESALTCGADLVVQSLHKTLPALTQTALLHLGGNSGIEPFKIKHQLDILQTSSPSYLLMASIDRCVRLREEEGYGDWLAALEAFYEACRDLKILRVFPKDGSFRRDPSKIVISVAGSGHSGSECMQILRERYGYEPEMAAADYVIAMTGAGDRPEKLLDFAGVLRELDTEWISADSKDSRREGLTPAAPEVSLCVPRICLSPWEALEYREEQGGGEEMSWKAAEGRISADYLYAYPPGIPFLAPGEIITPEVTAVLQYCRRSGIHLRGADQTARGCIRVLR